MSGRAASPSPNRSPARFAKFFLVLGLLVGVGLLVARPAASGQDPKDAKKEPPKKYAVTIEANADGTIRSVTFREEGSMNAKGEDWGADVQKSLLPKLKGLYESEKKRIDDAKVKGTEIPSPKLTLEFAPQILQAYVVQVFDAASQAGFTDIAPVPLEKKDAKAGEGLDARNPLPPHNPAQVALAEKFRIPNRDSAYFKGRTDKNGNRLSNTGIEDFEPVASETKNSDEYQAWTIVVQWAKQDGFTTAELEQNAGRELTRDDLINNRFYCRLELLRFDGKLAKVRRAGATKALAEEGTTETYEALLVPIDEPPNGVVSFVFTELPAELAEVKKKAVGEWWDVDQWASAAGWFFKIKQDGPGTEPIPLLIGRSVTPHKTPPPQPGTTPENPTGLDKKLRVFQKIKDDAFIAKEEENWEEWSAWNRVLLHARRFMPEELERHAAELKFADLFTDGRRDYKLDLVKFEGRLVMLDKTKPGRKLAAAGIETAYEGWLIPKDEPRGNPVCVVFTDPPEGVEPTGRVNKWVSFAGYSFKLLRYKSGERDKEDPSKNVTKRAPLLIGRAVIARPDPDAPASLSWGAFANTITLSVLGLLAVLGGLTWWYRRGDRRSRQEVAAHRGRNPFGTTPE